MGARAVARTSTRREHGLLGGFSAAKGAADMRRGK
jgi:hypothetical protein